MIKTHLIARNFFKSLTVWTAFMFIIIAATFQPGGAEAAMKSPPPETIKAIIIGDRVVDIAYNLGVLPEAMSVRGSLWPMAGKLKTVSQMLGCPSCTTVMRKKAVPNALTKRGIKRVIVEKSGVFCIYKPKVKPENIVSILAGMDVAIEYVDFRQGLESAIRQTAKLLGREAKAENVIQKYKKEMAAAKTKLPAQKLGKKVIILSGIYQPSTGKSMLRVEAPGGYSDRFFLEILGCVNAGNYFKQNNAKAVKGHYLVRKKRGQLVLDPLIKANPDVIVMTGDAFAVQKALWAQAQKDPALAKVSAIKDLALYCLPFYADSGVIEYPNILKKWAIALAK